MGSTYNFLCFARPDQLIVAETRESSTLEAMLARYPSYRAGEMLVARMTAGRVAAVLVRPYCATPGCTSDTTGYRFGVSGMAVASCTRCAFSDIDQFIPLAVLSMMSNAPVANLELSIFEAALARLAEQELVRETEQMLARTANLAAFVNPATRVAWLADHGDDHVVVVDVAKALLEAGRLLEFHGEVRTMLLPHARSIGLLRQLLSLMPATEAELDALDTLVTIVQIDA